MVKNLFEKRIMIIATILIVLGFLFTMFIIKPGVIGYATYQRIKNSDYTLEDYGYDIRELKSELLVSNTNLSSCTMISEKLLAGMERQSDKFSECKSELSALGINFNFSIKQYEESIGKLETDLREKNNEIIKLIIEKQEEITSLETLHDLLVRNIANNICCKAKVDNPDINHYKIEDNKILCVEEGILRISCFGS